MTVIAVVNTLDAGYESDRRWISEASLALGDTIEVTDISMGQSHTTVYLKGFQRGFNSVFFRFEENGQSLNIYEDTRFNPYLTRNYI